ncbi:Rv3654c family TadE-like protein [Streptomyces zagrosensis]|nr:Rv3654c family TadE-like protein [Streptomyces zagrosensis]
MATVWVAVATSALCAVFAVVLSMGSVVVARHRAGGAADMAALAAADHALLGERVACALAERVAHAQGARIVRCAVRGEVADLVAEVPAARGTTFLPSRMARTFTPRVRSRAGPSAEGHTGPAIPSATPGRQAPAAMMSGAARARCSLHRMPAVSVPGISVAAPSGFGTQPSGVEVSASPAAAWQPPTSLRTALPPVTTRSPGQLALGPEAR